MLYLGSLNDNLSHGASRLRARTLENVKSDLELVEKGILDFPSFLSGYEYHNHPVELTIHDKDGTLKFIRRTHNLRTNKGGHDQAATMISIDPTTSNPVAGARYVALSNATFTPNAQDTTLAGEITSSGLGRVLSTPAWVSDPSSINPNQLSTVQGTYKLTGTWTASGGVTGIVACGVFNAASVGDLWFESVFGSVNVNSGDTVTLTYTINY